MIKQTFITTGSITSSGELSGDQTQPPDVTHLTHPIPKPRTLARKLRDGEYREIRQLAPDSLSLLPRTAQVLPRFAWAEHWTEAGLEEFTGPPTLCFLVLINAENDVSSWKRTNVE